MTTTTKLGVSFKHFLNAIDYFMIGGPCRKKSTRRVESLTLQNHRDLKSIHLLEKIIPCSTGNRFQLYNVSVLIFSVLLVLLVFPQLAR